MLKLQPLIVVELSDMTSLAEQMACLLSHGSGKEPSKLETFLQQTSTMHMHTHTHTQNKLLNKVTRLGKMHKQVLHI